LKTKWPSHSAKAIFGFGIDIRFTSAPLQISSRVHDLHAAFVEDSNVRGVREEWVLILKLGPAKLSVGLCMRESPSKVRLRRDDGAAPSELLESYFAPCFRICSAK
jgi:hypothetical protein